MDGIKLKPIQLGVEVSNVHLADIHSLADIETLKQLVHEHRIAVFRNQPDITPEKQVEISKWFGELDSDAYYKHDKSPLRDIFRVSNDRKEGCTNVGRTGWHIDGTFRRKPYSISVYHMKSVPLNGDTRFIGLNEVLTSLQKEQFDRWNRIWMVTGDHHSRLFHPLVYPHPITGKLTMCFHLGMTDGFMQDYGSAEQRMLKASESVDLLREIHNEIVKNDEKLVYSHKWTEGDFILSDNLAVGHEASPETQRPISEVGLRILHRVTVAGKFEPKK